LKKKDWIGLAVPIGMAIATFFAVAWIIKNVYLLLAASVIGALLGGALLYLFGGILLVIIGTLVGIMKIIRGK